MRDYESNDLAGAAYLARDGVYERPGPNEYGDDSETLGDDLSGCPACGSPIDYCSGHGEIGDPEGCAILERHDAGNHEFCHPAGCEDAA